MKNYIQLSLIFATIALFACRPEPLPINLKQAPPKLVISSQVIPGGLILVSVTKSFSALENTDTNMNELIDKITVSRARVEIIQNGNREKLDLIVPGFYGLISGNLTANQKIDLEVYDSSSGLSVSSSAVILPQVEIDSIQYSKRIGVLDTLVRAKVFFKDLPGENYYMVNFIKGGEIVNNAIKNPQSVLINNNESQATFAITDQLFENTVHGEVCELPSSFKKGDTVNVALSHISREYYTYLVQKQRSARNGWGNIFGEPVNYLTNIKNGYGFFTAHWPSALTEILP